jgi:hypothetical protein
MSILSTTARFNMFANVKTYDDLIRCAVENLKDSRHLGDALTIQYDLGYIKGLEDAKKRLIYSIT